MHVDLNAWRNTADYKELTKPIKILQFDFDGESAWERKWELDGAQIEFLAGSVKDGWWHLLVLHVEINENGGDESQKQIFRPCDGSKHGVWVFDSPLEQPLVIKPNLTLTPLDELGEQASPSELDKIRGCKVAYGFTIISHPQILDAESK